MMIMNKFLILFLFLAVFATCTPKVKDAGTVYFAQAETLKLETESIQQAIKEDFQNLRQRRNNIMVQGRALTESELTFIDRVNELIEQQGKLDKYLEDIARSEEAYGPNGKELLYLNEQANQLIKQIQQQISKLKA